MRQRAISAAVLVPGPARRARRSAGRSLAAAVALITVARRVEVFRLLTRRRLPAVRALGTVLALVVVLDAAVPELLDGQRPAPRRRRDRPGRRSAAFTRIEPRDGLQAWMATVFGALYVALLSFIIRLGHAAPAIPARRAAQRARCASAAGSCC